MSSVPAQAERPVGRLAVLGLGLMGGSLVRGVSGLELAESVTGWSPRPAERKAAVATGAVSVAAATWRDAVGDADLVVLAVPLTATVELLEELAGATPASTTLTDLASLKAPVSRAAAAAGVQDRWVGSHPMAGSESSGFEASRADLYRGARVWMVSDDASSGHRERVQGLWRGLGAEPAPIEAEEHDRLMGLASHLPQLLSNVLASVLHDAGVSPRDLGPGGRGMTRLAASSPSLWLDLLRHAPPELPTALRFLGREAERVADLLEAADLDGLDAYLRRSRGWKVES